jgi:hypothetical protein
MIMREISFDIDSHGLDGITLIVHAGEEKILERELTGETREMFEEILTRAMRDDEIETKNDPSPFQRMESDHG